MLGGLAASAAISAECAFSSRRTPPVEDEGWHARVREAFGLPEPMDDSDQYDFVIRKYGGPQPKKQ
jgi:hypothetical protein